MAKAPLGARAAVSPRTALRRGHARALYEAAEPSRQRKFRRGDHAPNKLVDKGAAAIRTQMRYLERNHDITKGSLDILVNNIAGPNGVGVEFQPRVADGSIHEGYAAALASEFEDWGQRPEVTHTHDWQAMQRLTVRTWMRDGEMLAQRLLGPVQHLDHGTRVPLSLEMFESDFVPLDYNDDTRRIRQGIEVNAWGRRMAAHVFKRHPGEQMTIPTAQDMKRIPWDRMLQVAELTRLHQLRGVSRYASAINRIEDIKDYEESERVAAKVAAMLTAYVKRLAPSDVGYEIKTDGEGNQLPREIAMAPGTIIDTLQAGEDIGLIDTNRPNVNLVHFRNGQLRAFAAAIKVSFSSLSRSYDGTYSAQRQELVEQWVNYATDTDDFIGMFVRPVVQDFIAAAHLSGVVRRPADVVAGSERAVQYLAPSMPWIDPAKEALAWLTLVQAGFASEVEVIRKRGQSPEAVLQQVKTWRAKVATAGLTFNSDAAATMLLKNIADDPGAKPDDKAQAKAMMEAFAGGRARAGDDNPIVVNAPISITLPEQAAPVVNIAPAAVTVAAAQIDVHVPEQAAPVVHVAAPQITVEPAAVTVVSGGATEQVITRDIDGEIARVVTRPVAIQQ